MTRPLTPIQSRVLAWASTYIVGTGHEPMLREIGDWAWTRPVSKGAVYTVLRALRAKGYITWKPAKERTLSVAGCCPVCGSRRRVQA